MSEPAAEPCFAVISGAQVLDALAGQEKQVIEMVEAAYLAHGAGQTVNPPSYFLRFPDRPDARIIALPASVRGGVQVDGLKWIASFPGNVPTGLPRASGVLLLNDPATGYPFACLEASVISAARTAASAALAADRLSAGRGRPRRLGFVGTGLIARYVDTFLAATGFAYDEVGVHDISPDSARRFAAYVDSTGRRAMVARGVRELIESHDLIVFATVAAEPHVHDPAWFGHNPLCLHVSLRDLAPEVVLPAVNIVDDVEHCLKANTSVHLAEQQTGNRDFVHGTLYDVLTGSVSVPSDRPVVFSPFGLGVLDLVVGKYVYDTVSAAGSLQVTPHFFAELDRYAPRRSRTGDVLPATDHEHGIRPAVS